MNKRLLLIGVIALFIGLGNLYAQDPASATWQPTNSNIPGNPSASIVGDVTAANQGGTLEAYQYSTNATAVSDVTGWQRLRYTDVDGSPYLPVGYDAGAYLQYQVSPATLKYLKVTSFAISVLGAGSSYVGLAVKYAVVNSETTPTDGDFNYMPVSGRYFLANGNTASYSATATTPVALVNSGTTANTEAKRRLTFSDMNINLNPGQTFYIRLYPFITDGNTGSRYLMTRNTVITGLTSENTLPLNFLSFTAKPNIQDNAVTLNWQTANEVNTKEFVIERRTDETEFKAIDTKACNNTSGIHHYTYIDNNVPSEGKVYYRLKQVDNDAEYQYSNVVVTEIERELGLVVYPNPAENVLNIEHLPSAKGGTVKVLDASGKVLISQSVSKEATSTNLNVAELVQGIYLVVYDDGVGNSSTMKFVKK